MIGIYLSEFEKEYGTRTDASTIKAVRQKSGTVIPIRLQDGHAVKGGETHLMDPSHPVWDGKPPVIAWPDL